MKNLVLSRRCIAPPGSALLAPLIVLVLSLFSYAQGQRITISGTVMDENGTSLPGVNVLEKGTSNGTTTSSDGQYTIEAAGDATLVFSFVGYRSLEIPVNNRSAIDASLEVECARVDDYKLLYESWDSVGMDSITSKTTAQTLWYDRGYGNHKVHSPPRLFNLSTDISEQLNIAGSHPDSVARTQEVADSALLRRRTARRGVPLEHLQANIIPCMRRHSAT